MYGWIPGLGNWWRGGEVGLTYFLQGAQPSLWESGEGQQAWQALMVSCCLKKMIEDM